MDATLSYRAVRRGRRGLVALALGMTTWAAGCSNMDPQSWRDEAACQNCGTHKPGEPPAPPAPPPIRPGQTPKTVTAYWERNLKMAPDTAHDGQNQPGLVGRVFLLDQDDKMICFDGTLTVKLFDEKPAQGGPEVFLEQWNFDKASLHKLQQKDSMIGWGYTVFLPTMTATNPNIKHIRVVATYTADGAATPIVVANSMRLEHPEMGRRQLQPGVIQTQYGPSPGVPAAMGPLPGYPPTQPMGGYPQQAMPGYPPQMPAEQYPQTAAGYQVPQMPMQQPPYQYQQQPPQAPVYQTGMQQPYQPVPQPQYQQPAPQPQYQQPMPQPQYQQPAPQPQYQQPAPQPQYQQPAPQPQYQQPAPQPQYQPMQPQSYQVPQQPYQPAPQQQATGYPQQMPPGQFPVLNGARPLGSPQQ